MDTVHESVYASGIIIKRMLICPCVSDRHTYTGLLGWNIYKKVNDAVVMHIKLTPVSSVRAPGLPLCSS
jgi:hypothetical protein